MPNRYTPTVAEVDVARAGGAAAAARRDGSADDVPYRLLGAEDRDRALVLSRLWFIAFTQARAWRRERWPLANLSAIDVGDGGGGRGRFQP